MDWMSFFMGVFAGTFGTTVAICFVSGMLSRFGD